MTCWRRWALPAGALGGAFGLLLGAVGVGLQVPAARALDPLPRGAALDYSAGLPGIAPLSAQFVAEVLGLAIEAPGGSATTGAPRPARPAGGEPERLVVAHPPTNDAWARAYPITRVPFTARTNTGKATREPDEPTDCAARGGTVWYRYKARKNIGLAADTIGSRYATTLGVFSGERLGGLQSVGCTTDLNGNAYVAFPARAGTTYYFQVTGPLGGGSLVFSLDLLGTTTRVSVSSRGVDGNGNSRAPSISADGRFVAFVSGASNLVSGDANGWSDVFVRDRAARRNTRVSVSSQGAEGDAASLYPSISAEGRFVAFESEASNLVPGDFNRLRDIFVHDRATGRTSRVSVSSQGAEGNGNSQLSSISADGRFVAFWSGAKNLVPGDANEFGGDVFVHDRAARRTTRVSASSQGAQGNGISDDPSISADGRFVAFSSDGTNLVQGDRNCTAGQMVGADLPADETVESCRDVFVHDRRPSLPAPYE